MAVLSAYPSIVCSDFRPAAGVYFTWLIPLVSIHILLSPCIIYVISEDDYHLSCTTSWNDLNAYLIRLILCYIDHPASSLKFRLRLYTEQRTVVVECLYFLSSFDKPYTSVLCSTVVSNKGACKWSVITGISWHMRSTWIQTKISEANAIVAANKNSVDFPRVFSHFIIRCLNLIVVRRISPPPIILICTELKASNRLINKTKCVWMRIRRQAYDSVIS